MADALKRSDDTSGKTADALGKRATVGQTWKKGSRRRAEDPRRAVHWPEAFAKKHTA